MTGPIKVVVADRRRAVAALLASGLRQSGLECSAAAGLAQLRKLAESGRPDVLVADVGLLAAARGARTARNGAEWAQDLGVPLIVLSEGARTDDLAAGAVRAGVRGWVPKDSSLQHLLAVIRGVHRDETWVPPPLLTRVIAELTAQREDQDEGFERLAGLTAREREVLSCLCAGMSRPEIGRHLFLSTNTVRTHVQNLMIKLDVHSSVAAVALAHRLGLPTAPRAGAERA